MKPQSSRYIIAIVRRMVFSGLILLLAYSILLALRGVIPESVIGLMRGEGLNVPSYPGAWDWTHSLTLGKPVADIIGPHLGITMQLTVFGGILGLVIAALLLFLGELISHATDRPPWLAGVRSILRSILVSSGAGIPIFVTATLLIAYKVLMPSGAYHGINFSSCLLVSLVPAWLLVQAGQGEIAKWSARLPGSYGSLILHLLVRLFTMSLKLVGAIIVAAMFVEVIYNIPGSGRLFVDSLFRRDFPLMFASAWTFAVIVVPVKLVADLIDITYNHFSRHLTLQENTMQPAAVSRKGNGWLIFCGVLVTLTLVMAVIGPALAPYGMNEINMMDRLAAPASGHILGTDQLGRDIFSRILSSQRFTLLLPLLSLIVLIVATSGWAILAAFVRKSDTWLGDTLEDIVMLPRDVWCAFPWLMIGLILMSIVGLGSMQVAFIGGLVLFPRALGVMREAYRFPPAGKSWLYSVSWSIPVMVLFTVAGGVLFTSSLGFLGYGVPPPSPDLGAMISSGLQYALTSPWILLWPGISLALLLFIWIMAGDALTERLRFRSKALWSKIVE